MKSVILDTPPEKFERESKTIKVCQTLMVLARNFSGQLNSQKPDMFPKFVRFEGEKEFQKPNRFPKYVMFKLKNNFLNIYRYHVALITGLLFLSGCGFHLRGAVSLDLSVVHIQSESANKIAPAVARRLTEEGVQVVPTASTAQAVVYLRNETVDKRILSVSSVSGKLEEYELSFRIEMEVRKPDGTVLMDKQVISLLRDYRFDETAVLAMWAEEEMLRQSMFRDLVAQIMRRLQVLKLGKI